MRLIKRNKVQYERLFKLFHLMIRAQINDDREFYETVITQIREEVKESE